jgi:hypothetical protein
VIVIPRLDYNQQQARADLKRAGSSLFHKSGDSMREQISRRKKEKKYPITNINTTQATGKPGRTAKRALGLEPSEK